MLEHDVAWHDGAVCAIQRSNGLLRLVSSDGRHWEDGTVLPLASDYETAVVKRETYEAVKANKTPTEQILHDRGTTYGSFSDNARVSQEIKASIASGAGYDALTDRHKEALDFIAGKIARIVNGGSPDYADNWDDISGYALLGKKDEKL